MGQSEQKSDCNTIAFLRKGHADRLIEVTMVAESLLGPSQESEE